MLARIGPANRLFRQDRQIAINLARANFPGWRDWLMAAAVLGVVLFESRNWAVHHPWRTAAWAALATGGSAGLAVGRLLATRLAFHRFDGLLAADAVQPARCLRYLLAWHGIAVAVLALAMLAIRASLLPVGLPAYLAGALVAAAARRIPSLRLGAGGGSRTVRDWLNRPTAGIAFAVLFALALPAIRTLPGMAQVASSGGAAFLVALALTIVDPEVARFRLELGHRPWRIALGRAAPLLVFAAIAAPLAGVALGPAAAAVVLVVSAAMLMLLALRILAYCAYRKRFADLLVSIFVGLLAVIAYSLVLVLPFVAAAMLWRLQRRAAAQRWMLA